MLDGRSHCATVSISDLSPQDEQASTFSNYRPLTTQTFGNTYHHDMRYHLNFSWWPNQSQMQKRPNASGFNQQCPNFSQFRQFQIKVPLSSIPILQSDPSAHSVCPTFQPILESAKSIHFSYESSHFASFTTSVFPSTE